MKETFSITKNKVAIFIIIVTVLLISYLGLFYYNNSIVDQYYKVQADEDINTLTLELSKWLNSEISNCENEIEVLSKSQVLFDPNMRHEDKIEFFESKAKELGYEKFFIANYNGETIDLTKSSDKSKIFTKEYFKQSIKGRKYCAELVRDKDSGETSIVITSPIYKDNKIVGVFGGLKKTKFLNDICKDFQWKNTGTLIILDSEANIILSSNDNISNINLDEITTDNKEYFSLSNFYNTDITKKLFGTGEYNFNNEEKIAGFYNLKSRGFTVLISIDKDDLYSTCAMYKDNFTLGILCSFGFSFIVCYILILVQLKRIERKINPEKENKSTDENNQDENTFLDIENIADKLTEVSDKIKNISQIINKHKPLIDGFPTNLDQSIEEERKNINKQIEKAEIIKENIDNIGKLIEEDKTNINSISDQSHEIEKLYKQVTGKFEELMKLYETNRVLSTDIKTKIDNVKDKSYEIKSSGEMLKSLSEQIQLLSLNAAIEVSRNSEMTEGFLNTADEIKKLSEKAIDFSDKISKVSDEFITCVYDMSADLRNNIENHEIETNNIGNLKTLYKDIYTYINKFVQETNQLLSSNSEIKKCKDKISRNLKKIDILSADENMPMEETIALALEYIETIENLCKETETLEKISQEIDDNIEEIKNKKMMLSN